MSGKGDDRRPMAVPRAVYDANWARIFGPKEEDDYDYDLDVVLPNPYYVLRRRPRAPEEPDAPTTEE